MNTGPVSLNVIHIWAMRMDLHKTSIFTSLNETNLPLQLIASSQMRIENLSLATVLVNDTDLDIFSIEVVTARGNKFASKRARVGGYKEVVERILSYYSKRRARRSDDSTSPVEPQPFVPR